MVRDYTPWSRNILQRVLNSQKTDLPILDIQFGGDCNLRCIYCDTPLYGEPCILNCEAIEKLLESGSIQWVYSCGLGEPTAEKNMPFLKRILRVCKKNKVKMSIFSNLINMDEEIMDYIDSEVLYVLFKLDSFRPEIIKTLYMASNEQVDVLLDHYDVLKKLVHFSKDGSTNLAASIVPTKFNIDEIPFIVKWCEKFGIYPFIGQLERCGRCGQCRFSELYVEDSKLLELREHIENTYGKKYVLPVCPATILAIHVTNRNMVTVDAITGLSCGWFWMEEKEQHVIGWLDDISCEEIQKRIFEYRKEKFNDVVEIRKSIQPNPFGGCGGDITVLFDQYIQSNS